jgi:hypothetical protein
MVIFILAFGALYHALQLPEAVGLGALGKDPSTGSLETRVLNLTLIFIPILIIVTGPVFAFNRVMSRWKKRQIELLDEEEQDADPRRVAQIDTERNIMKAQTTWPKRDGWFWVAVVLFAVLFLVPVGSEFLGLPLSIRKYISIPWGVKEVIHAGGRRKLPEHRNFLVAAGLEQAIAYLEELAFSTAEIEWLPQIPRFQPGFGHWLENLRFTGDVNAKEGTVFLLTNRSCR